MKIVLFSLTGFGNKVLEAILKDGHEVSAIFTRKEAGPYPYYKENNITEFAKSKNILVYEDPDWEAAGKIIGKSRPEIIIVATFHRIIPEDIISSVPYCINLHPGLLPKYRGSTPIAWALHNKETITGVTAHFLTKDTDSGDILMQERIAIEPDDNEGSLRRRLSVLSAEIVIEVINKIQKNELKPYRQNEKEATYFPKFDQNKY